MGTPRKSNSRPQQTLRRPLLIGLARHVLPLQPQLACNLIGGRASASRQCSNHRMKNPYFEPLRKNFSSSMTSLPSSRLGGGSLAPPQNVPKSPIVRPLLSHRNSEHWPPPLQSLQSFISQR